MEFSEGDAVVVEPGAAFVSFLELSELGEVVCVEAEGAVISFLLDSCGTGAPGVAVLTEVEAEPVVVVESVVAGAGAVTVLVDAVVSVAGAELLLLQPEKASGMAANKAAIVNLRATSMDDIFMILFPVNGYCSDKRTSVNQEMQRACQTKLFHRNLLTTSEMEESMPKLTGHFARQTARSRLL